jgi:hypothetical protein
MPGAHIRCWLDARLTRHTGRPGRRNWRPDDNQNRAYPSRQTVQRHGTTSRSLRYSSTGCRGITSSEVRLVSASHCTTGGRFISLTASPCRVKSRRRFATSAKSRRCSTRMSRRVTRNWFRGCAAIARCGRTSSAASGSCNIPARASLNMSAMLSTSLPATRSAIRSHGWRCWASTEADLITAHGHSEDASAGCVGLPPPGVTLKLLQTHGSSGSSNLSTERARRSGNGRGKYWGVRHYAGGESRKTYKAAIFPFRTIMTSSPV